MGVALRSRPSKRDAILDAMLDIVVERGFHDAPMSLVAERSGASTGVIYHHFASKEEIVQALYERIRKLKIQALLGDFSPDQDPYQVFLQGCLNSYNFCRKHPREMRFYEQYQHAGFPCASEVGDDDMRVEAYARLFSSKSQGGVLKDWPAEVIQELTLNTVTRLASQPRPLPESMLLEIARNMWDLLRAE